MIYFLDNSLQLQKIVTSKNAGDPMHHEELNGLIHGNVELDLSYANKFLILGIDHVGYYYKDEFYLHKIQRVEYDHVNESVKVVFRHIFFEDMLFGPIIKDVRPKNQDAVTILRQTIEANTRWQIVMTDVTGTLSTNFYWQVPYEVIEFVNKNFRVDMFPKILFDGKNINGFQLHVKNASSSEVKQRIPFGSRVLDLKYEEDFSEIVTKLVGHGKGEEVGDGYGRRITFSEINFNRNGVESPVGSVYMEDPSVTNTYGNDGQTPREGRVVFEDIESPSELAEATYQHYLDVSRPQMLFTADVADIGDVNIGDSVLIVRREYDVYFKARIHKLSVNLLNPKDAQVELGDYEHFKESKIARKSREKNNRVQGQLSDRITRLKREANERFDNEVAQWKSEYEQALIDVHAEIEADRENMTNLIEGTRAEFTDNLNAEITQSKEYAEQQAQEKAEKVRTDLETVTSGHQALIDGLKDNVLDIDTFLGDKSKTLSKQFSEMESGLNQSITAEAGRIDAIVTNFGDSGKSLAQFVLDVDSIETTVAKNDEWLDTHGSNMLQTVDGFEQKVWMSDIQNIGANLIPFSDTQNRAIMVENWEFLSDGGSTFYTGITSSNFFTLRNARSGGYLAMQSRNFDRLVAGQQYTLSFHIQRTDGVNRNYNYTWIVRPASVGSFTLGDPTRITDNGDGTYLLEYVFTSDYTGKVGVRIGSYTTSGLDLWLRVKEPKLERGTKRTPYMTAFSVVEQRAEELSVRVQELSSINGEELITQSDISVLPDRVLIGSQNIGAIDMASIISVSPSAIDLISDKINVTGNVNIKGGVTALAVDAIEGNFARLFANQLTANVIKSTHVEASTALVDKMFATSARIDQLITKTHFVNEMHALTLNVVELNASEIRARLLTANTIEAEWLKSGTALIDRVFASTAMFERMMAKSAFVTTLSTVTLDLHELTIWRPDGVAFVQNGMERFGHSVPLTIDISDDVTYNNKYFETNARGAQQVAVAAGDHAGRYYNLVVGVGMRNDAQHASTKMAVIIRPQNVPSGASGWVNYVEEFTVFRGNSMQYHTLNYPMGRPTYGAMSFTIEFWRIGDSELRNPVQLRTRRSWVSA